MTQTNETRPAGGAAGPRVVSCLTADSAKSTPARAANQAAADEILNGLPNKKPRRHRISKTGLIDRRAVILEIVRDAQPATVRQVFYLTSIRGVVTKDEFGYDRVQCDLLAMRREGQLPYGWIVDHTRWQRRPVTFDGIDEALSDTAATYRKALWRDAEAYVEVWLEKDALSGVVLPVMVKFDVPLMVARGYASETFLHASGGYMATVKKPCFVYHFGDFDPSGQDAARAVENGLRRHARDAEIHFERVAVTQRQIDEWDLPTRPTKQADSRAKKFGPVSVELDAIPRINCVSWSRK